VSAKPHEYKATRVLKPLLVSAHRGFESHPLRRLDEVEVATLLWDENFSSTASRASANRKGVA
jgi:hypothetical protein